MGMEGMINQDGKGLNFGGQSATKIERNMAILNRQNARRVPCLHCGLRILPGADMRRHVRVCHED